MKPEPIIISVGRMVEQKGFDRLLRVCKRLVESGEPFRCEIIGEGPLRARLEALVEEYGLQDRVALPGKLHQEELLARYAAADLFVLLCMRAGDDDRDGIPNVLIEAMATELPVVSTRFSGVPELVVSGETGLLLEPDDEEGQVDAVRTMLRDPDLRARMGRAGRRRVMDGFTTEASAARLDALFSRLTTTR